MLRSAVEITNRSLHPRTLLLDGLMHGLSQVDSTSIVRKESSLHSFLEGVLMLALGFQQEVLILKQFLKGSY